MTMRTRGRVSGWSRREAMRLLGFGSVSLVVACRGGGEPNSMETATESAAPPVDAGAEPSMFPDGAIVRTILGDVPPDSLRHGAVLFHEHMSLNIPFWDRLLGENASRERFRGSPDTPYFMEDVDVMVAEMQAAAREGIAGIVDGGHADMGRSIEFLQAISEKSGLPIVASGGYYTDPFHPPELANQTEDEIAEALAQAAVAERWGAFGEIGSSEEITPGERKAFRAVRKAAGKIQAQLAQAVELRYTPRLKFTLDEARTRGDRVLHILDELEKKTPHGQAHDKGSTEND